MFHIEETLKKEMGIPVFHDDQHGTAIISGAALLNACELTGRRIEDVTVVVVGAGAAGMACARFYCALGVKRENIRMFDSKGLIHKKRSNLAEYKLEFAPGGRSGEPRGLHEGHGPVPRPFHQESGFAGYGALYGRQAGVVRHGESGSGNLV